MPDPVALTTASSSPSGTCGCFALRRRTALNKAFFPSSIGSCRMTNEGEAYYGYE